MNCLFLKRPEKLEFFTVLVPVSITGSLSENDRYYKINENIYSEARDWNLAAGDKITVYVKLGYQQAAHLYLNGSLIQYSQFQPISYIVTVEEQTSISIRFFNNTMEGTGCSITTNP